MAEMTPTPDSAKSTQTPHAPEIESVESNLSSSGDTMSAGGTAEAKAKFAKAIEEAKAGAQALKSQAQDTAGVYREKITGSSEALMYDAKAFTGQAKEKAASLAIEGKARTVEALSGASRLVTENAAAIDEKLGVKYGDYARSAARTMDDAAARLDAKDLGELGEDARQFVRNSPGLAVGLAAAAGFMLSRLFKGSDKPGS